jgi:hypothetical protein
VAADSGPITGAVGRVEVSDRWSTFVAAQGHNAGFLQTASWARIEAAANGAAHRVIEIPDAAGPIRAGALISIHRVPRRLVGLPRSADVVINCSDGPVYSEGDTRGLREVLAAIDATAASLEATAVRMRGLPPAGGRADAPEIVAIFSDLGYRVTHWATSLVALDDDADMRARLKPAARKAIRRAHEAGVVVRRCETREEFARRFVAPYSQWTARNEAFTGQTLAMWDADEDRAYHYFVALLDDRPIATLGTYRWNGVATEIMSGRAPDSPPAVPAQDLIHWEAFRTQRELGDRVFDLAGYNPEPGSAKEQGIRRFKLKWGGSEVGLAMFEQVRSRRGLPRLRLG